MNEVQAHLPSKRLILSVTYNFVIIRHHAVKNFGAPARLAKHVLQGTKLILKGQNLPTVYFKQPEEVMKFSSGRVIL
jgi:hypothetical protein